MTKKEITIDDLAMMVQNGFMELKNELKGEIQSVRSELKSEIQDAKSELKSELKKEIQETRDELKGEIREVKNSVTMLEMNAVSQPEFTRLEKRVNILEQSSQPV